MSTHPSPLRVLLLCHDPDDSISRIRLGRPLELLERSHQVSLRWRAFHDARRSDRHWADIAVMQRPLAVREALQLAHLHAAGVPVVLELDDLLTDPAPHLLHAAQLRASRATLIAMLEAADLVTAASERLAVALAAHSTRRIRVVPNGVPGAEMAPACHRSEGPITLIVASSDRQAVNTINQALASARAATGPELQLLAIGPVAQELASCGIASTACPLLAPEQFMATLARLDNPVGLIPIDDSVFSSCKTAIKHFDYALAGVVSVCADRPPFSDLLRHGQTGWLCADTPAAWLEAISTLAGNAALRQQLVDAARAEVLQQHSLSRMAEAWSKALHEAGSARRTVPMPRATRWLDRLRDGLGAPTRTLRGLNRCRLKSRQRRMTAANCAPATVPR